MSKEQEYTVKSYMQGINKYFRERKKELVLGPDEVRLKIERGNGIAKNFLRLCNKTMIGLNRIHISRGKVFAGFAGMFIGYFFSQCEETVLELKRSYKPAIKSAIILHVLQNQEIKDNLNRTLLENVYKNPQVQYSLHEVLDWKAIRPQMNDLFQLSKQAILQALSEQTTIHKLSTLTGEAVLANRNLIGNATLDFLQGEQLTTIVIREITHFFAGEIFYRLLAKEIIGNVNNGLKSDQNRDKLYDFCRENFLNW